MDDERACGLPQLFTWTDELADRWEHIQAAPINDERVVIVDQGANATRAEIFIAQSPNHADHYRERMCAILTGLGIEPPDIRAWGLGPGAWGLGLGAWGLRVRMGNGRIWENGWHIWGNTVF